MRVLKVNLLRTPAPGDFVEDHFGHLHSRSKARRRLDLSRVATPGPESAADNGDGTPLPGSLCP